MRNDRYGNFPWFLGWLLCLFPLLCSAQDTQPPTTPTGFTATASSSTGVVLNWNASTDNVGVTGYQVERCQGSGCTSSFTQFNISPSGGWANTGLTPSTTYGYRVRARDAVPNYSAFTSIVYVTTPAAGDTQAPTTPTGFTATASSSTGVVLNWTDSTDNVEVTGYQVERCQGSGCTSGFTQFDISPPAGWANTGLTPSTTYGYRVRARDAVPNYSAFTSIVYVTTQAAGDTQAPTTPTGFTANASSSTGVVLNWIASTDNVEVTGYQVERCQGSGCTSSFTQFNISPSGGWANTGLTPSTTYGYRVRARDAVPNYSAFTSIVYVTTLSTDTQAPTTPTGFTANASSSTGVVLNWTASTDNVEVTGYQVERCQGSGCTTSFTQFNISPSSGWANTGLTASTTYGYRVRARDAVPNYSAFTSIVYVTTLSNDTTAPSVPTNFTATASSSTEVVLNWSASTDNVAVTGYQVERCQGSGCNSSFTPFDLTSAGWTNTGLTASTTYGYRVRAKDAAPNYSAFTSIVYVTTQGAGDTQAPTTPTGFTAAASSSTGVVLNWIASTDNVAVTGYQVERCQGSGCTSSFTQFNISPSSGWANTGLTAATTYGYRVRARDAIPNYSAFTSIVYVTTQGSGSDTQAPTVPTNLTATAASTTEVALSWTASTDNVAVTGYDLERCQGSGCNASFTPINVTSTGYSDTGRTANTTYGYRVRAKDAVPNYSAYTSIVYVTTQAGSGDTQAPSTPGSLTVVSNSNQLTLTWSVSTDNVGVIAYLVERCVTSACTYTQIASVTGTSFADATVVSGTNYSYRVRARDAAANSSAYSTVASGSVAGTPTSGTVTYDYDDATRLRRVNYPNTIQRAYTLDAAGNRTQVQEAYPPEVPASITVPSSSLTGAYTVTWAASNTAGVSYQLFEATNANFDNQTAVTSVSGTTASISGKGNGTYYYRVRACLGQYLCSGYRAGNNSTLVTLPPTTPASITVPSPSYTGSYTVSWGSSEGTVSAYQLYEATSSDFSNQTQLYSGTGNQFPVSGRGTGTYYYRVRACNGPACSDYRAGSNAASVTIPVISLAGTPTYISNHGFNSASADYTIHSFGDVLTSLSEGPGYEDVGDWIAPKVYMQGFEGMISNVSGTCSIPYINTWRNLGSSALGANTSVSLPSGQTAAESFCYFTIQIRAVGGSSILATANITLQAWVGL